MEGRVSSTPRASLVVSPGEVSEWLKEHAWKVCIRQRIEGSNPSLSATSKRNLLNKKKRKIPSSLRTTF